MTNHPLAQNWRIAALLRFAAPTIFMMLFMGLYTIVDILFVSRFVGSDALSAINIVCPITNLIVGLGTMLAAGGNAILSRKMGAGKHQEAKEDFTLLSAINIVCPITNLIVGLGTMLAAGGNAILSRKMGAGKHQEAKEDFTLLILSGALIGVLLLVLGTLCMTPLLHLLGASPRLMPYAQDYLFFILLFAPANMLQTLFASLFITAGKPNLGACLSVAAGITNIILDYLFIVICDLGIRGAALGTGMGMLLPSLGGIIVFSHKKGILHFTKPVLRLSVLTESCFNGASELVSQCAAAVTTLLFNLTMMRLIGEDGVAAITIIIYSQFMLQTLFIGYSMGIAPIIGYNHGFNLTMMRLIGEDGVAAITIIIYSQFMLQTLFIGYSMGIAPIIGYNHGSENHPMQRRIMRTSLVLIGLASLLLFALSRWHTTKLIACFATPDTTVFTLATQGFTLFTWSVLFCGTNIFTSAAFTALSNGRLSATLSFLRTFGLLAPLILTLPNIANTTGLWLAIPLAESIMWVISVGCLVCQQKRYGY